MLGRIFALLVYAAIGNSIVLPYRLEAQEKRAALVIGNSNYRNATPLQNPANDAADLAAALKRLGFEVVDAQDLGRAGMASALQTFSNASDGASLALFYYAGHGLQVGDTNYLVPVDASFQLNSVLGDEMLPLDAVQRSMARASVKVIVLDACRDNPLVDRPVGRIEESRNERRQVTTQVTRSVGRGLAPVESGEGSLIVFSTQPGNVAIDGAGRNSPFAAALLEHLRNPNDDFMSILISVRRDVVEMTGREQVPWEHSSLITKVYLAPPTFPQADGRFTYDDYERITRLARKNELIVPDFRVDSPPSNAGNAQRFVGIWIEQRRLDIRRLMIIIYRVENDERVLGFHLQGPSKAKSYTSLGSAMFYPFTGTISGNELRYLGPSGRSHQLVTLLADGSFAYSFHMKGMTDNRVFEPVWRLSGPQGGLEKGP
jgi:hypothetical protein